MIAYGILVLLRIAGLRSGCARPPGPLDGFLRRGLRRAVSRPPIERAAAIGLLTGLLPCGWLYAFVIAAGGMGDPLLGAAAMSVFWSGTLPVMVALGAGVQGLLGPLRRHAPALTASMMVVVGAFTVLGRLSAPTLAAMEHAPPAPGGDAAVIERVEAIRDAGPPCCNVHD
jgi:sulfite exporter TauE/SafE